MGKEEPGDKGLQGEVSGQFGFLLDAVEVAVWFSSRCSRGRQEGGSCGCGGWGAEECRSRHGRAQTDWNRFLEIMLGGLSIGCRRAGHGEMWPAPLGWGTGGRCRGSWDPCLEFP